VPMSAITATIIEGWFEKDGKVLQLYDAETLAKIGGRS
jgi:hypothetical protein